MSVLLDYPDFDTLMMGLAKIVAKQLMQCLAKKGCATLAVPGGTTPAPFLERLSLIQMDWAHVTVLLTDERIEPSDPFRSNFRMIEHYLSQNASAKAQLLPMGTVDQGADIVLAETDVLYKPHLPIDVLVLGMGTDMHTASLFPDAPELQAALAPNAPPLMVISSDSQPEQRLTMTAPVLSAAENIHLLIAGPEKLASYIEAEEGKGTVAQAPVRCVLHGGNTVLVHHTLCK